MSRHVFTSDLHLGDAKVARLRGYEHVEDHDADILHSLRRHTYAGDVVWLLGDIVGRAAALPDALASLRYHLDGRRARLILGNHDPAHPMNPNAHRHTAALAEVFEWWGTSARVKVCGQNAVASHFPYVRDHTDETRHPQWRLPNLGAWLIHGHTHGTERVVVKPDGATAPAEREIHVGWDAWARPVADHELAELMQAHS